jgi:hypothetical protein
MGWWESERNGKEVTLGDGPLDTMHTALSKIHRAYKRDLKRKPTPEELTELIESSIRVIEDEIFDDMEERELDSVAISLRSRPKRPRPKPGDYFAIPLPSGGYGYGRIMKVEHRILISIALLNARSDRLVSEGNFSSAKVIYELHTATHPIIKMRWHIVGHKPLSEAEEAAHTDWPLWPNYPDTWVERIAEWKLSGKPGLPTGIGL